MKIYCTICSKDKSKDKGKIPSIERYVSRRIDEIYEKTQEDRVNFMIFSGKYGLIGPETKIPFYDKKLMIDDLGEMVNFLRDQLKQKQIKEVVFFSKNEESEAPYRDALREACYKEEILFTMKTL
jgi:hypothetical protein